MPQSSFSLLFCFVSLVSFLWGMSLCLWQVSRSLNYAWRTPFHLCCYHCQVSAIVVVCMGSRSMSLQVVVWISNEWRNCGSIEHLSTKTKGWKVNIVACAHGLGHSWATFKKESKQMWVASVSIWRVSGLLLDFCVYRSGGGSVGIVVVDEFCLCVYVCFFLLQQWWYVVTWRVIGNSMLQVTPFVKHLEKICSVYLEGTLYRSISLLKNGRHIMTTPQ